MIVTRLIGGLGNQLFQYAFGYYLANKASCELVLDVSAFDEYNLHALAIDPFRLSARRLNSSEAIRVPRRFRGKPRWTESIANVVGKARPRDKRPLRLRREKPFGFAPEYLTPASDLYLDGYWQSEEFFPGMRDELRREFSLATTLSDSSRRVLDQIQTQKAVAMHVRRGDYVTNPETNKIYRCLDASYYRRCLTDLRHRFTDLTVFLFSNDVQWCLDELDVGIEFIPVTHNDASTAYEDMYLMSQCDHSIIANSSFSWWAAYLGGTGSERRVYYPDPWFNRGTLNGAHLGCRDWICEKALATGQMRSAA